ncbi:scarecrow-like protein 13 [Malania oleifera]|uniref:scarecrow-like protein 13 n=1 Tax=Malania oleifera TaxID=397392 RepID=UPI0025AE0376|nr:scarecrow-like protein 13 [Malania oleifera]XP_057960524.1 scarecrow-like protein 13 [Malania oleifera]
MRTSKEHQGSGNIHRLCHQPAQEVEPYCTSQFHILDNSMCADNIIKKAQLSLQTCNEQFFTLESSPATAGYVGYDSPSGVSVSSNRSPFSPQGSQSCLSDPHQSPDNNYGSPISGSSGVEDSNELRHRLRELEVSLLGPDSDIVHDCSCSFRNGSACVTSSMTMWNQMAEMIPSFDLKQVLISCAQAVSEADVQAAVFLMDLLGQMVSVSGDPAQRLGAYLLEGLRARLESSGSSIYKALKCEEPTSSELMSYMHILYQICPYWKFAYMSSNVVIGEAMKDEPRIHIIDFQIAQGSQWVPLIKALAVRPGGPPCIRITGIDDSQSAHARGGGLHIVGRRLAELAESCGILFEFHAVDMSGSEVELENLHFRHGEALAVNFPFVLHHMPDESVSTINPRDRLLRLVKSLSPKVVTLVEQESNTNTAPFLPRFLETLDYYTAMFESIDVARPRDDKQRISAEQHCVARDIVNIIACEGDERVERHELLGKWRSRFLMAGFTPYPMSSSVTEAIRDLLKDYSQNYRIEERWGAVYLGWMNRALATSSAWKV